MKFIERHPFADPDAARKVVEIANASEAVQDGRIYIELVNGTFLDEGGSGIKFQYVRHRTDEHFCKAHGSVSPPRLSGFFR
jgi:hypothetical protein